MARRRPSKKQDKSDDYGFIRIGGGWEGSGKSGAYISMKFTFPDDMSEDNKDKFVAQIESGGLSMVAFENTRKKGERSPDWNFYVSQDNLDYEGGD